jgi:hypothetical protein
VARWCRDTNATNATNATNVAATNVAATNVAATAVRTRAVRTRAATPAARGAGSSARQREREVHIDGDGDAAISVEGLCHRLHGWFSVGFLVAPFNFFQFFPTAVSTFNRNLNP